MAQSNFPLYKKTLKAYNNIFGSKNNKAKIEWGAWNSQKAFKSVKMYEWCHLGKKNEKKNRKNRENWETARKAHVGVHSYIT